ncbi:hypothetical protein L7F22_066877 [Adiantum nelumboides]|nr:hypothetical protein [Adiantum nelumboides]
MYSGGHQFSRQAKEEFLKKRAFGSLGTFGMSNVSSTTFFASTAHVAAISNMKANATEKLKEKQQCLEAIKIALDQSMTKRDEQVGVMRGAAKIIERLNKDMEELKLHKAGLVPNEEAMAKLETLIQIKKEALKDMGLDIEVHNLDNLGEEAAQLQCLFHGCEEPLKDALKPLAPKEANMDEHVDTVAEKDPREGIFGSPVDGIDVCGEIWDIEKRGETLKSAPHQRKKLRLHPSLQILLQEAWYLSMAKLSWIGDVQEPDETVEDIAAKQDAEKDANVTSNKVEEDQEPVVCPKIEEILPNCPGWGYLVLNFCKIKKLIILDLNGLFVKQDVSKRDPKTGKLEHPPRPASDRVNMKRVNEKLWIYYHRDVEQFVWDLRQIADAMILSNCTATNIELILRTC